MLATTFPEAEGFRDSVLSFADSPADSQVVSGCQFFKVFDEHQLEYVLLANGNSDDVHMVGRMAAFQIQNLLVAYKERFDKDILSRICCLTICCSSIFTIVRKSCISTPRHAAWYSYWRSAMRRKTTLWRRSVPCLIPSRGILSRRSMRRVLSSSRSSVHRMAVRRWSALPG